MEILKYIKEENVEQVENLLNQLKCGDEEDEEDIVFALLSILCEISNPVILTSVLHFINSSGYLDDYDPINGEPLVDCINRNDIERLQIMVDNLYHHKELFDPCPLCYAIKRGNLKAVKLLEQNGVVMVCGDGGKAEFIEAIYHGHLEIVKYYCEEVVHRRGGFDPKDNKWVKRAIEAGHSHIVEYLAK